MIKINEEKLQFHLTTKNISYVFVISDYLLPKQLYFGKKLPDEDFTSFDIKYEFTTATTVNFIDKNNKPVNLETERLEYSFVGIGDYRNLPFEAIFPDNTYNSRFQYVSYSLSKDNHLVSNLPHGRLDEKDDVLTIKLVDEKLKVEIELVYIIYENSDCFGRYVRAINQNENSMSIRKALSFQLDIIDGEYKLLSFNGNWGKEAHKYSRTISLGTYTQESTTGSSSNRVNPGFILAKENADENVGECISVNLIYSGNHYSGVNKTIPGNIRIFSGINPFCFEHILSKDQVFETPEALISFSDNGLNRLSQNNHKFINEQLINPEYQKKIRPVVINSWETFGFDFNERKLLHLAKQSKKLSIDLFVLDDGWFGMRDNDSKGLGDYTINPKTLKNGLNSLITKINKIGLDFGIWVEPEMISYESELYHNHPEYALITPNNTPLLGRNQLYLNLTLEEVQEYIISNLINLLESNNIKYLKWDMNRPMSDIYSSVLTNQGEFFHKYILALYKILKAVTTRFPKLLIESCASGGNRFDLGMLYFSPQIWTSDNTDPCERIDIQKGISYLYPLSCISNHVSYSPHFSTLRKTELSTRFNVACFGLLGYELNLTRLSKSSKKQIKDQIEFYKANSQLIQYGDYYRENELNNFLYVSNISNGSEALQLRFQKSTPTGPDLELFKVKGLNPISKYEIKLKPQTYHLSRFGEIIKHALPKYVPKWVVTNKFWFNILAKIVKLKSPNLQYQCSGVALSEGIALSQQFMGTGYSDNIRIMSDNDSEIYIIKELEN